MTHSIYTTPGDTEVTIDLIKSEAAYNIARHPQLLGLIKEALVGKKLVGPEVYFEHNFGRTVGYDLIIETSDDAGVFYAQVLRESTYTRFIKGVKPPSTNYIAVGLKRSAEGHTYELQNVRLGRLSPPRPGAHNEASASRQYWANHAIVYDGQALQVRTVTKGCPY